MRSESSSGEAEERTPGLSRAGLVERGLNLVQEKGLDALTMRALADRLHVKAASLYWHVRDRQELLELLADSILEGVHGTPTGPWRSVARGTAFALAAAVAAQRDAARILLEVPDALQRSAPYLSVKQSLQNAGLQPTEAGDVAFMLMVHVIVDRATGKAPLPESGAVASIAVDSGSRGVVLRHGSEMETLIRIPLGLASAAPAIVRGETVKVRRLRGVGLAEIELNPRHAWRFQIQGPTWNTVLNVGGLDVREIKLDSGAAKVECFLPRPRGVVPIIVSGGVVGVTLHRPPGVAVVADISPGSVRLKLDTFVVNATTTDLHWESAGASGSDRYEVRINGGAVQVTLDDNATEQSMPASASKPESDRQPASALEILLDGVERRVNARS